MCTPVQQLTEELPETPLSPPVSPLSLPPSPLLQQLGWGTGVNVFRIERPVSSGEHASSPWAIKFRQSSQDCKARIRLMSSRLLNEAAILRSLNHPNIVGFRGWKKLSDGREVLAMEDCSGSLGDMLEDMSEKKTGPLSAVKMIKICKDTCSALHYLHNTAHLLHADLKSYNILIKNNFEICKLCDFGVSMPLDADGYIDLEKNENAAYIGTALWSAPETLEDVELVSFKADIFSFGLVLFECIALAPPHMYVWDEEESNVEVTACESNKPIKDIEELIGTRPTLPHVKTLGEEYETLIKIYNICTNELPDERPTANIVLSMFNNSQE